MARQNTDVKKNHKATNLKTKDGGIEKSLKMTKTPKTTKKPKGRV